jgi:hypothetical protein
MGAVKPPVRRSPKAGKLNAPEVKGEFGKGNEPLQELRKLSTEVIVGLTEYPEVQRDQDTAKAPEWFSGSPDPRIARAEASRFVTESCPSGLTEMTAGR